MTNTNTATVPGHTIYGTAPRCETPASMVSAGLYELSPTTLRPDGSKPRALFDVTTAEGQAARDAYVADLAEREALKDAAYARHLAAQGVGESMGGEGI